MANIDSSVGTIRKYFKNKKAASYKIKGHPLEKSEDYIKGLYFEMLCVILQYDGTHGDEQTLFVKRLMEGSGMPDKFTEYMRKALQVDEKFADEFVKQFKDSPLKYNFIADSLILTASRGVLEKHSAELISEICEILLLNKKDVDFLVHIALSILEQDSSIYMDIQDKQFARNMVAYFICYFKQFFTGRLTDTDSELLYFSAEKTRLEISGKEDQTVESKQDKVIFENYIIYLNDINFKFIGCKSVEFINCNFSGVRPIVFENCRDVSIKDCNFNGFSKSVFKLKSCNNFELIKCNFKNCGKIGKDNVEGGIIYSESLKQIAVKYCDFNNCFIKAGTTYNNVYGIVFYGDNSITSAYIENNSFEFFDIIGFRHGLFYGIYKDNVVKKDNTILDNIELIY